MTDVFFIPSAALLLPDVQARPRRRDSRFPEHGRYDLCRSLCAPQWNPLYQ